MTCHAKEPYSYLKGQGRACSLNVNMPLNFMLVYQDGMSHERTMTLSQASHFELNHSCFGYYKFPYAWKKI